MTSIIWTTLTLLSLGVELDVPDGWFCKQVGEHAVMVYEDDQDPFTATFEIQLGEPEAAGRDWFRNFVDGVLPELKKVQGFEYVSSSQFQLASNDKVPVYVIAGRRPEPGGSDVTTRMMAWAWVNSHRMYAINGASVTSDEARNLAIFDHMLHSLRLLD